MKASVMPSTGTPTKVATPMQGQLWPKEWRVTALYVTLILLMLGARWVNWPPGVSVHEVQATLVVLVTLGAWAFGLMPEPLPTLTFFLLVILFNVASARVVLSGFTSTAWWLVFGGSVIGVAIKGSGLGTRIAATLFVCRQPSYKQYLIRVALLSVALAFLMPSTTGRIMLLTPIVVALAEELGYEAGSNGRTGLILAVAAASYMPSTAILPANLPNSVLLGAAESMYGIKLSYGSYLLLHFPVLGALKTAVVVWVIARLFPETSDCKLRSTAAMSPMSPQERLLLGILSLSVLLFATDFLHGISPAWVSLGTGLVCLWPTVGLVSIKSFTDNVHLTPLIYVAGFLGLGALVADSGMGLTLGHWLLSWAQVSPHQPWLSLGTLAAIDAGIGLLTTLPSLPAVLTPLAKDFAQASGLPLYTILMLQVPVYATVFLPYQSPPMMIAMTLGGASLRSGTKLCLVVALISIICLLPLDMLWWKVMGLL